MQAFDDQEFNGSEFDAPPLDVEALGEALLIMANTFLGWKESQSSK